MPTKLTKNRRRPFSGCGHKGLGVYCHRCKEAERMQKFADGELKLPGSFGVGGRKYKDWFADEAKRLRGPQKPKTSSRFAPVVVEEKKEEQEK